MTKTQPQPLLLTTKFSEALTKVQAVIVALKASGNECRHGSSLDSLFAQLRHLNKQYERDPSGYEMKRFLGSIEALWVAEALELAIGDPASREAIHRIVSSDMSMSGRQLSQGKDSLWELDLYRRLKRGGATIRLEEPDLVVDLGNSLGRFGVACKKVYSESGVRDAFEVGCGQLRTHGLPGVVAFNLDDLMPEKTLVRAQSTAALHETLARKGKKFATDHEAVFKRGFRLGECEGVLISISAVSLVEEASLPINLARVPVLFADPAQLGAPAKDRIGEFTKCIDRGLF